MFWFLNGILNGFTTAKLFRICLGYILIYISEGSVNQKITTIREKYTWLRVEGFP